MDITKQLHAIANKRQIVLWGLDADATKLDRAKAKIAFEEETKMLNDMAKHFASNKEIPKCINKACPKHDNSDNGCSAYSDLTICVDRKKEETDE